MRFKFCHVTKLPKQDSHAPLFQPNTPHTAHQLRHHTYGHETAALRTAREPMRTAAEGMDYPKGRVWVWISTYLP